jgi:hypothetical protein
MTTDAESQLLRQPGITDRAWSALPPVLLFLTTLILYSATAARGTLFGDPSEYQFIPAILGIAHPPGYAFYTLLAKLWQTLTPIGTIAFRTNLLAGAVGAWGAVAVYLTVQELGRRLAREGTGEGIHCILLTCVAALAGLSLAVAPDYWQHSIHSNAHIVSAALATTHIWLLIRWWATGNDRWLTGFAICLGLAATHHPITLMGVPAYGLFVLAIRPRLFRDWKLLLMLVVGLLAGLLPLLYYPLRSPTVPFGPTDMASWQGFWQHVTASGLRVNLFHFGLADQLDRAQVFWSLLRLQFPLPIILFVVLGAIRVVRTATRPALLIGAFLAGHLLFTLNTVQDVMAYLLLPFAGVSILAGIGGLAAAEFVLQILPRDRGWVRAVVVLLLLIPWPVAQAALNLSRGISLRDFVAAEEWVEAVHHRFDGREEGAVLLSDWEHLTPLWVHTFTQGEQVSESDVDLIYVSTANPWPESVWTHIEDGPIYLPGYRPSIRDAGFRLVPQGEFYQVLAPPVAGVEPSIELDVWFDERVHILGYDMPSTVVRAGDHLVLDLYQSAPEPIDGIWMPFARLGQAEARWTTDSRLLTNQWQADEVVVERYEIPVPFMLPSGEYPLQLGYSDLTGERAELISSTGGGAVDIATVTVLPNDDSPLEGVLERSLANLDNQIGLMSARARASLDTRRGQWDEPLIIQAGRPLHLTLTWQALASPRESHTVFIHLLDSGGQYVYGHDYTPLGGSSPTYLWFPKWLPGQVLVDPYRLVIPPDLPAGDYWLEVGMYGMTSLRRLPVVDLAGNLAGDRVILGPVRVEGP